MTKVKIKTLLVFFLLSVFGYSQHNVSQEFHDIIKKNKVYKRIEYIESDSANYFKNYPNGLYKIFDLDGNIIEENYYYYIPPGKECEVKNFYIYYKGKELAKVSYDTTYSEKIAEVRVIRYDSSGKEIGNLSLSPFSKPDTITYDNTNTLNDDSVVVMKEKNKTVFEYGFYGKARRDTVYKRTLYYSQNRLDSQKTIGLDVHWGKFTTFKLHYKDSVLTEIITLDDPNGDNCISTDRTTFFENGLPDAIYHNYWDIKTKKYYDSVTKFKYSYWH